MKLTVRVGGARIVVTILALLLLLPLLTPVASAADVLPPIPPVNPSPASGAGPLGLTVPVSWTGGDLDSPTVWSTVYVQIGSAPQSVGCTTTTTSCTLRNLPYASTVNWHVEASDGTHNTVGSTWTFTTKRAPLAPSSPTPSNGGTGVSRTQALSWSDSDPDGFALTYRVVLTDQNGVTGNACNGISSRTCDPGRLAPSMTYTWQVFANDSYGETPGPAWSFTTVPNVAPSTPALGAPADNATVSPHNVTFSWSSSNSDGDVIHFQVLATGPNGMQDDAVCATDNESCTVDLDVGASYTWYVVANDTYDTATSSNRTLTTRNNTAPFVTNVSPMDDERNVSRTPRLNWTPVDRDSDPLVFSVYLGTNASVSQRICANVTVTYCDTPKLAAGTRYSWQVSANDTFVTTESQIYSFVTTSGSPPVVALVSPAAEATAQPRSVTLSWTATDPQSDPMTYTVYLSANDPFAATAVASCTKIAITSCSVTGLAYDTSYYWWVEATDGANTVDTGRALFRTLSDSGPDVASGPSPVNGAAAAKATRLSWTAHDTAGDPLTYTVYGRAWDSATSVPLTGCIAVTTPSCSPSGLPSGELIRWFVEADDGLLKTRSAEWTFTTPWSGTPVSTDLQQFATPPTDYALSNPQVFSHIVWDTSGTIHLTSDGRDSGTQLYARTLPTPLSRLQSWSAEVEATFSKVGVKQQANLLTIDAAGATPGDGTGNQLSVIYRSPGSTSPGLSMPNAYGLPTSAPWTPVVGHTYVIHFELEAATQAVTIRVVDKTTATTVFEASKKLAASASFGPIAQIGFATIGQAKSATSSDEAADVSLDNVKIVSGATLDGAIPIYMSPLPGAAGVASAPTISWSGAGYPAGTTFDVTVKDASGTVVATCTAVTTSCPVSGLSAGTGYSWSVAPHGASSASWVLKTVSTYAAPTISSLGSTANQGNFVFTWAASATDSAPLTYTLYWAKHGDALQPVCKTYQTTCSLGVWAPGQAFDYVLAAADGTAVTQSQTQSSTGPLPNLRYFVGSDSRDEPLGVPVEFDGWTFTAVPAVGNANCVPSVSRVCATVSATATTGTTQPIGWGFAGVNTGIEHNAALADYRWAIDASAGNSGGSVAMTMTPVTGDSYAMVFSYGGSLFSNPDIVFHYGGTSGAVGASASVTSYGSDYTHFRVNLPGASYVDGSAGPVGYHVDNPPSYVDGTLSHSYDWWSGQDTYSASVDLGGSSWGNAYFDLGSFGRATVSGVPSHYDATGVVSGWTPIKLCAGVSGTPWQGSDISYSANGDPVIGVDIRALTGLSGCWDPTARSAWASVSFATDWWSGSGAGVANVYVQSGSAYYDAYGSNLQWLSAWTNFGDTLVDGHFDYGGDLSGDAYVPNLMYFGLTEAPHSIDFYASKSGSNYGRIYVFADGGGSATTIVASGQLSGWTFSGSYQHLEKITFNYDPAAAAMIYISVIDADYGARADVDAHTDKLDATVHGQGMKNWFFIFYPASTAQVQVGANLRACYTCGSLSVTAHYRISSWSGVTASASETRQPDGTYRVDLPLALPQYLREGGNYAWAWYYVTYIFVWALTYVA